MPADGEDFLISAIRAIGFLIKAFLKSRGGKSWKFVFLDLQAWFIFCRSYFRRLICDDLIQNHGAQYI